MSNIGSKTPNPKYAWRELASQGLPKRSAYQRAADCLEIYGLYDETTAREQASRCIQCPNPTCVAGCPLCNPIPQWMQLTAEGRFLEAAAVLGSATNLAEICARMCPADHLCEGACLLEAISEPVAIRALEQFLVDYALAHGQVDVATGPPNGRRVAVVGSGPGCLACADELAKKGYAVTVFDSALVPGGLLVNGVPAFKLNRSIVERRLELLRKRGVVFKVGVKVGQDLTLTQLREQFDAVFLAWDSRKARPLEIPGAELAGVVQALPFLLQKNTPVPLDLAPIDVAGKRVVVIGGGDTAMDCLRAALRYGAAEAIGVYRRDDMDMPCSQFEYHNAREEGVRFVFCVAPVSVLANEQGRVRGLRLVRTEVSGSESGGVRPFRLLAGTEFDLPAELVIPALGFGPSPCEHTGDWQGLAINDWGGICVDDRQMTNVEGVFAGGDIVRGPSHVLDSVRDGRKAAAGIDSYLAARKT